MSATITDADFAVDRLQALLHCVDDHLEEFSLHLDEFFDALDAIQEVRRDLWELQADLVFGDPEVSPSARLVEEKIRGEGPSLAGLKVELAEVVKLARKQRETEDDHGR
jgi:hypothetical protein